MSTATSTSLGKFGSGSDRRKGYLLNPGGRILAARLSGGAPAQEFRPRLGAGRNATEMPRTEPPCAGLTDCAGKPKSARRSRAGSKEKRTSEPPGSGAAIAARVVTCRFPDCPDRDR